MPDKPFVINDRRKFTSEGEPRQEEASEVSPGDHSVADSAGPTIPSGPEPGDPAKPHREPIAFPSSSAKSAGIEPDRSDEEPEGESPSTGRSHETIAFPAGARSDSPATATSDAGGDVDETDAALPPLTAEQIDQAARAYNATVERLDTALRANNLGAEPMPEMSFERLVQSLYMQALLQLGGAAEPGQAPQLDLLGARQTIDMLALITSKAAGNLSDSEEKFVQSALFELRMGFLEMTQALARQAASRPPAGTAPGSPKGPGILR